MNINLFTFFYMYLLPVPGLILAFYLHEYAKAALSYRLGDKTLKLKGWLSPNPFKHQEPIGFVFGLVYGFGWGRPTPTSATYYKDRRRGVLAVYIAPSLVNVIFSLVLAIGLYVWKIVFPGAAASWLTTPGILPVLYLMLYLLIYKAATVSLAVALFNIIPIYPLDGSKILQLLLPYQTAAKVNQYEKILQLLLIFLVIFGIIPGIIQPVCNLVLGFASFPGL